MAEKLTSDGGQSPKGKRGRVPKNHNQKELVKKLDPFIPEMIGLYDKMEEVHGTHMTRINNRFKKIAEDIDFPIPMLRSHIANIRRLQKAEAKIAEMSREDLEAAIELAEGFAGTAFGDYFKNTVENLKEALKSAPEDEPEEVE